MAEPAATDAEATVVTEEVVAEAEVAPVVEEPVSEVAEAPASTDEPVAEAEVAPVVDERRPRQQRP